MNGSSLPAEDADTRYTTFTGWVDRPTDLTAPLDATISCDVAVVGGGLGGMATALRLAERGVDVVLLESDFAAMGRVRAMPDRSRPNRPVSPRSWRR